MKRRPNTHRHRHNQDNTTSRARRQRMQDDDRQTRKYGIPIVPADEEEELESEY